MKGKDIRKFLDKYKLGNASVDFDGYPPEFIVSRNGEMCRYILCEDGEVCIYKWSDNSDHPDWHSWVEKRSEYMEIEQ